MIDFKVLVKVNPEDPRASVKKLGEKVLNSETAFVTVDPIWVRKQDFITAVPVEIALTVDMRAVVQSNSPDTRFIVTGVTAENMNALVNDFGYKVYPTYEPKKEEKSEGTTKLTASAGQSVNPETHEVKYWYNGKEISEEEFNDKANVFRKEWAEAWGDSGKVLEKWLHL